MGGRSRGNLIAAISAALLCVAAIVIAVVRSDGDTVATPVPTVDVTPSPTPSPSPPIDSVGAATTTRRAAIRSAPSSDAAILRTLRAGILLPVLRTSEGFLSVLTPCEARGWVASADVQFHPRAMGTPSSARDATIVIDPGHGGQLTGAVGPSGLPESEPNMDIAQRLAARMAGSRVFLTRPGQITAGLAYRSAIANGLGAHAFVSVHNNADPDGPFPRPGTETYYQRASPASRRLAGLLYEELLPVLGSFEASWVADRDAGAKYRLNARGIDYYALLRTSRVPAVIVEALFVSNRTEEDLLRRPEVREAIAGALAAGLRRFFESTEPGSGFVEPYPREPGPSGRVPTACIDPTS